MENIVRAAGVLAMGVAVGVQVGAAILGTPAVATDQGCAGSVAVAPQQRGTVGRTVEVGRSAVTLEFVKVGGGVYGFARGGQAWLDRSDTGGASWERCGPLAAVRATDDPQRLLRACGRVDGVEACTEPF
ncbi:hypothetical protein [Actinoplanes sp. NBRC 103695]|uniref:hypothetical protein n=1 Tax=Actinoplanes sp. NBRC 103695 TaxID=3032202 RepID=UPI0025541A59|nr:hypothetical protein [Actinoplanes sp. NBRC 103695]